MFAVRRPASPRPPRRHLRPLALSETDGDDREGARADLLLGADAAGAIALGDGPGLPPVCGGRMLRGPQPNVPRRKAGAAQCAFDDSMIR